MSAGLPGLGLGGIFFILSALIAPLGELVRTARGRSSVARWVQVGRQFGLAVAMIAAVDATLRLVYLLALAVGVGSPRTPEGLTALPLLPVLVTISVLMAVLAGAKGLELIERVRVVGVGRLPAVARRLGWRELAVGVAAFAAAWASLLAYGDPAARRPFGGESSEGRASIPDQSTPDLVEESARDRDQPRAAVRRRPRGSAGRSASGLRKSSEQADSVEPPVLDGLGPGTTDSMAGAEDRGRPERARPPRPAAARMGGRGKPVSGEGDRGRGGVGPSLPGRGDRSPGGPASGPHESSDRASPGAARSSPSRGGRAAR